uniref:PSI domain-containing protein n=1 Tax=Aureoumbra lagunensis TaxID=44058 RepID=A0A7S3JXI6_9STRA
MLQQKKSVVLFILTIILNAREVKAQACTGSTKDCLYVESLGLIGGGPAAVCTDLIYQSNRNQDEFELCACTSASSCSTSTGRCSGCNGCDIYCWDCDSDTGACVRQGSTGGGGGGGGGNDDDDDDDDDRDGSGGSSSSSSSSSSKKNDSGSSVTIIIVIAVVIGFIVFGVATALIIYCSCYRKRSNNEPQQPQHIAIGQVPPVDAVKHSEVELMT